MRSRMLSTMATLLVLTVLGGLVATAHADLAISETWVVDPGYEAGGYFEFSVTNNTGDDVYMIAVGNNNAVVIFERPDLVTTWKGDNCYPSQWGLDCPNPYPIDWTSPDFSAPPYATLFGTSSQALIYYVMGSNPPIATGTTFDGFRWMPAAPNRAAASRSVTTEASPFVAYNGAGAIVAQGTTNGTALAIESRTWGGVKALYR